MQTKEMIREYEIDFWFYKSVASETYTQTVQAYTAEDALTQFKLANQYSDVRLTAIRPKPEAKSEPAAVIKEEPEEQPSIWDVLKGSELETAQRLYTGKDVKICHAFDKVCPHDCEQFNCQLKIQSLASTT